MIEIEPERSPAFASARERVTVALRETEAALEALLEEVDPQMTHHDDVAELLMASTSLAEFHRRIDPQTKAAVLEWLLHNVLGVRSVRVGDLKFWGEKEKTVKCLDVGDAFATVAHVRLENRLLEVAGGEEEARDRFWTGLRDVAREVVSANGLKEGACRKCLADDAETRLRETAKLNPGEVAVLVGESPPTALARAVEAARETAFLMHFVEDWPDRLSGGDPKTKLGVGNLRFLHRVGGGTKRELEDLERQRLAAGEPG